MNIFKISYKTVRENSDVIFKGFGFRHLSDATQYYVHPDNQSYKGTTTLCQPIGEAVILFTSLLTAIMEGKGFGDYFFNDDRTSAYLELQVPDEYHENGVVDPAINLYRAFYEKDSLKVAAYDHMDRLIEGDMEKLGPLYKLLPAFCVLLAAENESNPDFRSLLEDFLEQPAPDSFVNVHEDFYQEHKTDEIDLQYGDLSLFDKEAYRSFSGSYRVIRENKAEQQKQPVPPQTGFPETAFTEEQKQWIPRLSPEFILPKNLISVSNAVAGGDLLAVLLHGPAGTGKTMSCKLICQTIGLPILETVNCTESLDEFVLGKFIPEGDRIVFKESFVTKAIREGGAVVFEEINFAKPQHLAFLNSLLDDNGFVRLDNGEVVRRHPHFRFFATMNLGYFGTKELNQALYNRFNAIIEIAALSDEAILRMLTARVPACRPVADKLLSVYHKLKKKIEAEELDVVISPRNLENWARLAQYDGYMAAAERTIIPVAKCDRMLEKTIRSILVLYRWK
jgi:hypothetical protein